MKSNSRWTRIDKIISYVQWSLGGVAFGAGVTLKIDPQNLWPWINFAKPFVTWSQESGFGATMVLISIALGGFASFLRRQIGPPWVWKYVHFLLDTFRKHVFDDEDGEVHHHRVTLFKHRRCRAWWTFGVGGGWLVPVERSGHTTLKRRTSFRAPDNADRAEGIAGYTWSCRRNVYVENLPDISKPDVSDAEIEAFASQSHCNVRWVRRRKHRCCSRSYCGIPVEVKGERWGS